MMGDQEEEDLQMALKMSMQQPLSASPPVPKRSKPRDVTNTSEIVSEVSPEIKARHLQRELMAASADKRMLLNKPPLPPRQREHESSRSKDEVAMVVEGVELLVDDANLLLSMVFGSNVSKEILAQWSNQGVRDLSSNIFCLLQNSLPNHNRDLASVDQSNQRSLPSFQKILEKGTL